MYTKELDFEVVQDRLREIKRYDRAWVVALTLFWAIIVLAEVFIGKLWINLIVSILGLIIYLYKGAVMIDKKAHHHKFCYKDRIRACYEGDANWFYWERVPFGILNIIASVFCAKQFTSVAVVLWITGIVAIIVIDIYYAAPVRNTRYAEAEMESFMDYQKLEEELDRMHANERASWYFSPMDTKAQLKKKYREYMKVYHPDNQKTGDTAIMQKIKTEYEERMSKL